MDRSNYEFSHQNGEIKATQLESIEVDRTRLQGFIVERGECAEQHGVGRRATQVTHGKLGGRHGDNVMGR